MWDLSCRLRCSNRAKGLPQVMHTWGRGLSDFAGNAALTAGMLLIGTGDEVPWEGVSWAVYQSCFGEEIPVALESVLSFFIRKCSLPRSANPSLLTSVKATSVGILLPVCWTNW